MKISISFKLLLLILLSMQSCVLSLYAQAIDLNILTYNIRYANPGDAPNTWVNRKQAVFSNIKSVNPAIFGIQEALAEQVVDFENAFPDYTRVGVGRDNGNEAGEFSPLFFNSLNFKLNASSTFWLSKTPHIPGSRGWDAACNRIVTWMQIQDKKTGKIFFVFCTHFDHMGELARRNSAIFLLTAVDSLAGSYPAIVLGDFNANPGSEPYRIITQTSDPLHLIDAKLISSNTQGPDLTFSGFKVGEIAGDRIDYIFLKGKVNVNHYKVDPQNNGEYYPSDHLPVSAGLRIF